MSSIQSMLWIVGAIFFLVGLGLLGKGLFDLRKARQALQWPTTQGVITRSEIKIHADSEGTSYTPVIEYAYTVQGRDYCSNSLWAGPRLSASQNFAAKITARYPLGQTVTVTYNPAQPASAVLEPGISKFAFIYVGGGGFFILAAVVLLLLSLKGNLTSF